MRLRIGERLVQAGLVTDAELNAALAEHRRTSERLGAVLVRMNVVTEDKIARAIASQLGFGFVDLTESPPQRDVFARIPIELALKGPCIPVSVEGDVLTLAMSDPLLLDLVQELEVRTGLRIRQVVAARGDILAALHHEYERVDRQAESTQTDRDPNAGPPLEPSATELQDTGESPAIVDLANLVVSRAVESHATDVHVEPTEEGVRVRHRLDGVLKVVATLPKSAHAGLIARLKIMAGMSASEKRLAQDGRIRVTPSEGAEVDFRVSTLPTLLGERIVLRLLDRHRRVPPLDELGLSPSALDQMRNFLGHYRGLILVAGPTGSGKTTTLAAAVQSLRSDRANICTIEDPIEYEISGVNQTQINERITLTFASALKSVLQQQPDVLLVGELRDLATAQLAVHAAESRLVLSARTCDDGAAALAELVDIGIEPGELSASIVAVVSERLVRRLCVNCREQETPPADVLRRLNIQEEGAASIAFYRATGCEQCNHTGYRGRVGVFELMTIDDAMRRLIASRASDRELREAAVASGMVTLAEDALSRLRGGVTTVEELLRVVDDFRGVRPLCGACGVAVDVDYVACPRCGARLSHSCPQCGRSLQRDWNFCPYCARGAQARSAARGPHQAAGRSRRRLPRGGKVAEFKKQ